MQDVVAEFKNDPASVQTSDRAGSGAFSDVDITPCGRYAIKHSGWAFSDGWLLYAVKLLSMPKDQRPEWAPVIHSIRINIKTGTFTALMDAYSTTNYPIELYGELEEQLDQITHEEVGSLAEYTYEEEIIVRELCELLEDIEKSCDIRLILDMGSTNTMEDDEGQQIVTDPICFTQWRAAKKDNRYKYPVIRFLETHTSDDVVLHY